MANNTIKGLTSVTGLATQTFNLTVAGPHVLQVVTNILNPPSSLVITLNQNGSPIGNSPTPSPTATQAVINARALFNGSPGDVITVVFTSANPNDTAANGVESFIVLRTGV